MRAVAAALACCAALAPLSSAVDGEAQMPSCRRPAPAPAPSGGQCEAAALRACGQFGAQPLRCEACAQQHKAQLTKAGCTPASIKQLCNAPQGGCAAALAKDGCFQGDSEQCDACATTHRADLTKAGCSSENEVKALCGGTSLSVRHPPAQFSRVGAAATTTHELGYNVIEETLVSQSYFLEDGDLVFTDFADTPIPMPDGDYAILGFSGEMVDCNNVSVPLDVLYNHHWLLKPIAGPMHHDNAPCPQTKGDSNDPYGLNRFTYVFGVGAESRKTPTVMPDGFGYHVQAGTKWG